MKRLITDASLRGGGRYAAVLQENGTTLHQEVGFLRGRVRNSMYAEARALFVGLNRARSIGWRGFYAVTDNKNVVHMVRKGKTSFWHALRCLVAELGAKLMWRRRRHVERADRLLREHDALLQVAAAVFGRPARPA